MPRKLLPLAFVLALVAAACAEPPAAEVEFGSGVQFVSLVADSLNNSGVEASVAVTEGLPIVAYFAFEEEPEEDELPQTRPVGAPSIPGVMLATVSPEGVWTRGAIALQASIPNVQIPFNPAFDEGVADLTADNVTGLDLVVDGDTFHAVWGSDGGLYHATGSTDPASSEQVQLSEVTDEAAFGPSIAVVGGSPRIAYSISAPSSLASVELARPEGDGWVIEQISTAPSCDTCKTAVIATPDGLAVAFSAGNSVQVATDDGENGWSSRNVEQGGGQGLSGVATGDGMALSYYLGDEVHVATGSATGSFDTASAGTVAEGSGDEAGAETSIAADDAGNLWLGWLDADEGVVFASSGDEGFTAVDTQPDTASGAMPSVDVTPDGSTAFVAWHDTEHEDALVGEYGEIESLAIAAPSPEPVGVPPVVQPGGDCTVAVSGVVQLIALGIAFDASCVEVPAGEPFTIAFGNEDDGVPHNVAIYPSADDLANPLFRGENVTGVDSIEYQADALDEGEYYFQCDVHPAMNGTWTAGEGGGGGGGETGPTGATGSTGGGGGGNGEGGGGGAVTVRAQNIAFDTDTIELPAETASTITFDNQDSGVPHNIAIYADDALSETLFQGDVITGPDTIDYAIGPLEAGEYYFQCDVHPDMNGTVVVA